jgi:hypothetical protein
MKIFISYLLQFPLYYVVVNGLAALTGLSIWWGVPIGVLIVFSYDVGEMIRRREL